MNPILIGILLFKAIAAASVHQAPVNAANSGTTAQPAASNPSVASPFPPAESASTNVPHAAEVTETHLIKSSPSTAQKMGSMFTLASHFANSHLQQVPVQPAAQQPVHAVVQPAQAAVQPQAVVDTTPKSVAVQSESQTTTQTIPIPVQTAAQPVSQTPILQQPAIQPVVQPAVQQVAQPVLQQPASPLAVLQPQPATMVQSSPIQTASQVQQFAQAPVQLPSAQPASQQAQKNSFLSKLIPTGIMKNPFLQQLGNDLKDDMKFALADSIRQSVFGYPSPYGLGYPPRYRHYRAQRPYDPYEYDRPMSRHLHSRRHYLSSSSPFTAPSLDPFTQSAAYPSHHFNNPYYGRHHYPFDSYQTSHFNPYRGNSHFGSHYLNSYHAGHLHPRHHLHRHHFDNDHINDPSYHDHHSYSGFNLL